MLDRTFVALALLAMTLVPAATGGPQKASLLLDWTPNPDHVGFYYAREKGLFAKAGLEVAIRSPSDPTAALKLVAVGSSDFAVSYEQELFLAAASKLPVVAVAAVVPRPLNSIMAIEPRIHDVGDLKGKTIGITGAPSDYAALDTALASAGLDRKDVKVVSIGYNLLPALLAHKVDAVVGVYRNVEGIELERRGLKPTIIPLDRTGVPFYDELVLVANSDRIRSDRAYANTVSRFVGAFLKGTDAARRDPAGSLAVMRKVTASDAEFLARATPATLALLAGPRGVGCMTVSQWQRFGAWMHTHALVKERINAGAVMTTRFLPPRCDKAG